MGTSTASAIASAVFSSGTNPLVGTYPRSLDPNQKGEINTTHRIALRITIISPPLDSIWSYVDYFIFARTWRVAPDSSAGRAYVRRYIFVLCVSLVGR